MFFARKKSRINKFGLEFDYESEKAVYFDYPLETLPILTVSKGVFKNLFKCENLEDVLSVVLILQKKGMLSKTRNIGEKSIKALENYFTELGLLTVDGGDYTSQLCIS